VLLIAQAIREVGPKRERIRDWLADLGHGHAAVPGITGPLAFPTVGDRAATYVLVTAGAARTAPAAR
ncbi:MAG TPA: hypothetical protein VFN38_15115, partial [Gemmatimonadaceae bacterium]|nr:hypothetical protein [Gemmatimonadaceae bacterium]